MRACVLDRHASIEERPLRLADGVPRPSPGRGEALIRVRACGICRTDLHVIEGELDPQRSRLPIIPGHQIVGEIVAFGPESPHNEVGGPALAVGSRVGVAWLHGTCGQCRFCASGRENLCDRPAFTGWTVNGGFADEVVAPVDFLYPLPAALPDEQVAPLLCAGIIGFRCLRMTAIRHWPGAPLGLYGFGAAAHIAIQIAIARGAAVYVCTRDRDRHQSLAEDLGATWVGGTFDQPPVALDAAIIFAPAGEIVPPALQALDKGGRLVCGGIHMSDIPSWPYRLLYGERSITSVTNNTRDDGRAFLHEAGEVGVQTHVRTFPLEEANDALIALKHDAIRGAAVLMIDPDD